MTSQPGPVEQRGRPIALLIVIALLLIAVIVLLATLLSRPPDLVSGATTAPVTPTPVASVAPATMSTTAPASNGPTASAVLLITTPVPAPTRTASPRPTSPPTPAPTHPVIASFSAPATVQCSGTEALQITLSWRVDRATGVELAIDGPGKYDDYPATHSVEVPFSCGEPQHTYRITSIGGSGSPATQEKIVRRAT